MNEKELKTLQAQYRDASNDHRHYGSLIWQLPALAILVGGSLLTAAFNKNTAPFIRGTILGIASIFQFVMTSALVRYRLFQKRRRYELGEMDKALSAESGHTPNEGSKKFWTASRTAKKYQVLGSKKVFLIAPQPITSFTHLCAF